jgi:hypothetical protein
MATSLALCEHIVRLQMSQTYTIFDSNRYIVHLLGIIKGVTLNYMHLIG